MHSPSRFLQLWQNNLGKSWIFHSEQTGKRPYLAPSKRHLGIGTLSFFLSSFFICGVCLMLLFRQSHGYVSDSSSDSGENEYNRHVAGSAVVGGPIVGTGPSVVRGLRPKSTPLAQAFQPAGLMDRSSRCLGCV